MIKFSKLHLNDFSETDTIKNQEHKDQNQSLSQESKISNTLQASNLGHINSSSYSKQNHIEDKSGSSIQDPNIIEDTLIKEDNAYNTKKILIEDDSSFLNEQLQEAYQSGVKDTKKRLTNIIQSLKHYKNQLNFEMILKSKVEKLIISDEYLKNVFFKFTKNVVILILDQLFLTLPFDPQRFFFLLEQEMPTFYSHGKIIIKINPQDLELYTKFLAQTNMYKQYKEYIEISCDNNITTQTCCVSHQDISFYFDHNKLKFLLKSIIEVNL